MYWRHRSGAIRNDPPAINAVAPDGDGQVPPLSSDGEPEQADPWRELGQDDERPGEREAEPDQDRSDDQQVDVDGVELDGDGGDEQGEEEGRAGDHGQDGGLRGAQQEGEGLEGHEGLDDAHDLGDRRAVEEAAVRDPRCSFGSKP